jgi:hypothetical protein
MIPAVELLQFIKDDNWEGMLRHFPEGVQHRGAWYRDVDDFEFEGEDAEAFSHVARKKLKDKCLQHCIDQLINLSNTLENYGKD